MNPTLSAESESLIARIQRSGRYQSTDEIIQEALRLLDDQEALRAEIQIGWDEAERGELLPLDLEKLKRDGRLPLDEERRRRA